MNGEVHPIFNRYPDLREFVKILRQEIQQAQRKPEEIIMDDDMVMKMLNISKRKLQYLKSSREITYHIPGKGIRTYYLLSDILEWIKKGRVENLPEKIKIK